MKEANQWQANLGEIRQCLGPQLLSLLLCANKLMVLDRLAAPRSIGELAEELALNEEQVETLCSALYAHEVLDCDGARYRLSVKFDFSRYPITLDALLNGYVATRQAIESAEFANYTALPNDMVHAVAMLQPDPTAESHPVQRLSEAQREQRYEGRPEQMQIWKTGGRHIELGCGTGNGLLTLLISFPEVTAIGIEINPDAISEAMRRAAVLGVSERVEFVRADVGVVVPEIGLFDTAFWSQEYFSPETRAAALQAAMHYLNPGGYLQITVPYHQSPPETEVDWCSAEGRTLAMNQLVGAVMGRVMRNENELQAEIASAGFIHVRTSPGGRGSKSMTFMKPAS